MQTKVVIKDTNIDDAFVNIQKRTMRSGLCFVADLKTVTAALARELTRFPAYGFFRPTLSETGRSPKRPELPPKRRRSGRNETLISRGSLPCVRRSATQAAQQAALRQKFGDRAKAAAAALGSEMIA